MTRTKKPAASNLGTGVDKQLKEVKREWRHLHKFRDENRLLFAAFIIVLTALVIINATYVINHASQSSGKSSSSSDANHVLTSLQTGTLGSVKARVSKVTENGKTDYAFTIGPSETMLIMDISITNLSADSQHLIPVSQLYVRTDEGDYAALHASMYVTNPLQATDLKPGQTATGQISFNVPKRAARPLLYVDTGWDSYAPIVFDVLH